MPVLIINLMNDEQRTSRRVDAMHQKCFQNVLDVICSRPYKQCQASYNVIAKLNLFNFSKQPCLYAYYGNGGFYPFLSFSPLSFTANGICLGWLFDIPIVSVNVLWPISFMRRLVSSV